ncbi:hypothetical protein CAD74_001750 [Salmonella enterica subsp. arizonae serovar 51:z4,z23:-]|nr:hypothetical protein [Salmonella enterica subsp. arizonae]EDR5867205.1 hypothetical protein [Salmonella enterica subsp. arizonae serovar 51:z4,z23:-]EDS2265070.1 hypothetical protein [Salmonella enterica]EDS2496245.1 hypothetical protein [Salmonella enterica subsp. arizonae serovar 51:z4,z23:-]EDV4942566.1 hypothetical protein [Salmonella enterica subsp. arizonae]
MQVLIFWGIVKKVKIAEVCIFSVTFYVILRRRLFFNFKAIKKHLVLTVFK